MYGITDLRMFAEIARSGSMGAAAGRLGMAPATISGRLKALEEHFGVTLIRRTTRALALTEEGHLLLGRAEALLSGFDAMERDLRCRKRQPEGGLVISAPPGFGRGHILPAAQRFAAAHPGVALQFRFEATPGPADLRADRRADVTFRIGALPQSRLTTRKLADIGFVTCAAPAYLAARGTPAQPSDLCGHDCLLLSTDPGGPPGTLAFRSAGRRIDLPVAGRRTTSDLSVLVDLGRQGHGILQVHRWAVADQLAEGSLVPVLEDHAPAPEPLQLVSDGRRLLPMRTVRFIDFMVDHFRRTDPAAHPAAATAAIRLCA